MTPPALAAWRFAAACLYGTGLGVIYSFLRPLRPKRTALADGLFLLAFLFAWLELGFRICKGDLRIGYTAGLLTGIFIWELTLGKLMKPVFSGFWKGIASILEWILYPMKKFLQKIYKILKFIFASLKKWVTILWNNCRSMRHRTGGPHDKIQKVPVFHQTGLPKDLDADQDRRADSTRIVYGSASDAPWCH
jgi:hypothetical protein